MPITETKTITKTANAVQIYTDGKTGDTRAVYEVTDGDGKVLGGFTIVLPCGSGGNAYVQETGLDLGPCPNELMAAASVFKQELASCLLMLEENGGITL